MKLSKCPQCGNRVRVDPCGAIASLKYKTFCTVCTFSWKAADSEDVAIQELNTLCEENRIGKEALALVPDGYRMVRLGHITNGEWFVGGCGEPSNSNQDFGDSGNGYIVIEPIPEPPTMESLLAKCRLEITREIVGYREKGYNFRNLVKHYEGLVADIDAVLPAKPESS